MKKFLTVALAFALVSPVGAESLLRPENFAHKSAITTGNGGPFYRFALPLEVYQGVTRADIGDLRVFNGRGEVVPYALLRVEAQAESRQTEHLVPFFPLPVATGASDGDADLSVTVRQTGDGTLVAVRRAPAAGKANGAVRGVVLDASKLQGGIRSLRLNVGPSALPFHAYVIESSTDLQHWRRLKGDAQLVRLSHDGHQVVNDKAEWGSNADPYLRVLWADPQQAPVIRSVHLGVVETSPGQPVEIWSAPLTPNASQTNVYEYLLPGKMPLEKLRINLPQINTLTPLNIQRRMDLAGRRPHRHRAEPYWETLSRPVVYRLQSPQGELRSPDIDLSGQVEERLRLVIDGRAGGIGGEAPTLQVGFVPHVLVFLARGEGPFVLAWGADGVNRGELPVSTLLPGYEGIHKLTATVATLSPADPEQLVKPAASKKGAASPESSKWVLWTVMLLGLLVLGGMARTLLRQLRKNPESGD